MIVAMIVIVIVAMIVIVIVAVIVIVIVAVIVAVIVVVIVAMVVTVTMIMIVPMLMTRMLAVLMNLPAVSLLIIVVAVRATIGTRLRLEGGFHCLDLCGQPPEHLFEHVVRGNAKEPFADLHRYMPVAQVVGRPGQILRCGAGHMQHTLRLRNHFDHPAVAGDNQVAAAQDLAAGKHQRHVLARRQRGAQSAFLA